MISRGPTTPMTTFIETTLTKRHLLSNLALKKTAVQSSNGDNIGFAFKAVDGNRDENYQKGSCTLTLSQSDPWWRVDLARVYTIGAVVITNSAGFENRLDGAEIWIGKSANFSDPERERCAVISHIPSGETFYFPCSSIEGRYVTVFLPGSGKVLNLCEVEVYYGYPLSNVALKGEATQSSTLSFATASKAIDGRRNSFYSNGFCSHTAEDETDPWWRVDLQRSFTITAVKVTNRGDCCAERLDGAEIRIGNSLENNGNNNPRCASISHIKAGKTYTYWCDGGSMEGRFVNVFLPGQKKTLTLCEVEVYAAPAGYPLPNVALKGEATQSSTLSFATASKAIDGRRNSFYSNGFCSHTAEDETNPWWRVDLQRSFTVTAVKVTNRGDCCAERLDGAEIRIGNSLENNGNNNPRCASISHINAGKTYTYRCDGGSMEGRFVNVFLPGQKKTLTLCEVEVYAAPAVEPLSNVALKKPTVQSSTAYAHLSSKAVDGYKNGNVRVAGFSHTKEETNPWWRVDLLAVYKVSAVTIINRQDCCSERILGAEIRIGDSLDQSGNQNPRCGIIESLDGTPTYTFHCDEMEGRYINVIIPAPLRAVTLCEVEVFASLPAPAAVTPSPTPPTPPPTPPTVSVQLGGRNVTVVGERLCWSDALMYCRRYYWDLLSLHSQQEQSELEQLLGLIPFSLTDHVWLGLRRSLSGDDWFWMSGHSMNFFNWPQDFVPYYYSSMCGAMSNGEHFLWQDLHCGEHLNFICQSGAGDNVQRVDFYSTKNVTTVK
ncbi:hypothetical protein ACER0C_001137 [Sarotherodon galilaeus]